MGTVWVGDFRAVLQALFVLERTAFMRTVRAAVTNCVTGPRN